MICDFYNSPAFHLFRYYFTPENFRLGIVLWFFAFSQETNKSFHPLVLFWCWFSRERRKKFLFLRKTFSCEREEKVFMNSAVNLFFRNCRFLICCHFQLFTEKYSLSHEKEKQFPWISLVSLLFFSWKFSFTNFLCEFRYFRFFAFSQEEDKSFINALYFSAINLIIFVFFYRTFPERTNFSESRSSAVNLIMKVCVFEFLFLCCWTIFVFFFSGEVFSTKYKKIQMYSFPNYFVIFLCEFNKYLRFFGRFPETKIRFQEFRLSSTNLWHAIFICELFCHFSCISLWILHINFRFILFCILWGLPRNFWFFVFFEKSFPVERKFQFSATNLFQKIFTYEFFWYFRSLVFFPRETRKLSCIP